MHPYFLLFYGACSIPPSLIYSPHGGCTVWLRRLCTLDEGYPLCQLERRYKTTDRLVSIFRPLIRDY